MPYDIMKNRIDQAFLSSMATCYWTTSILWSAVIYLFIFDSSFTLHRHFSNAIKNSIYLTRALIDCWPSWEHVDHPPEMEHSTPAVYHRSIYSLTCLRIGPLHWYHMGVMATRGNSTVCPTACSIWHQRDKSNLHTTTLALWGNPPVTTGFPSQRASKEPSVPPHHDLGICS